MVIDIAIVVSCVSLLIGGIALLRSFSREEQADGNDHGITKATVDRMQLDIAEIKADVKTYLAINYDHDKRIALLENERK